MYRIGHVYKIYSELNDTEIYIGSTLQLLEHRLQKHISGYDRHNKHLQIRREASYDIFDKYGVENCKIELIKSYPVCDRKHLYMYEQLYMNKIRCINMLMAFQPLRNVKRKQNHEKNKEKIKDKCKQYRENNKENIKEQNKQYRENNKEKIKDKRKQYRENQEMIECECGSIIKPYNLYRHLKTDKHRDFKNNNK